MEQARKAMWMTGFGGTIGRHEKVALSLRVMYI